MKKYLSVLFLMVVVSLYGLSGSAAAGETPRIRAGDVNEQVRQLQERMMNDQEIMALVLALSADPEMQEIANDPAVLGAIASGDYDALARDPRVMRLLENARVRELRRRLGQ